jgi:hypothetical protein
LAKPFRRDRRGSFDEHVSGLVVDGDGRTRRTNRATIRLLG